MYKIWIYIDEIYNIKNGQLENVEIPLIGVEPTSGYLTYENEKFTVEKGDCTNIIYGKN